MTGFTQQAFWLALGGVLLLSSSCKTYVPNAGLLPQKTAFNESVNGEEARLFHLHNKAGMSVAVTNYGARLVKVLVPDKNGKPTSVVLGFDSIKYYKAAAGPYHGATVGRYANRIADGRLVIDGVRHSLTINNGGNTIHGGKNGFHAKVWKVVNATANTVEMTCVSADGEEGFPGALTAKVVYELTSDNALKISYEAATDKKTVINLTNHAFFNLNGEGSGQITDHTLLINADAFTPVNERKLPTGEVRPVAATPFDFRTEAVIGSRINNRDTQLLHGGGYDHNFVLNHADNGQMTFAARASAPGTGIMMEVWTAEPGLQFFSGNALKGLDMGRTGKPIDFRTAFCLETQHFPDSPNQPHFPTTELRPGQTYRSTTVYGFSTKTN